MELKIGEIFELNSEWYQCIVGNGCENCAFYERKCYTVIDNGLPIGDCCADRRKDNKHVIFKKLEKVGEPIEFARGLYFQKYRLVNYVAFYEGDTRLFFNAPTNTFVYIEIKTKEDMEENKLNLKPFDIQKAREGKPVCTRDGHKARIICFDAKGMHQPIIALITQDNGIEHIETYYSDGRFNDDSNSQSDYDLMILPEKKEGWVNVYKERIYSTKEEAIEATYDGVTYIDTIKISWEE